MTTFETLVLIHLTGYALKLLVNDKYALKFIDRCLVGSLSVYLFITLVLL